MKDLIIGCITGYDFNDIAPWVNSIEKCGFKGDKAMIIYNCSYDCYDELTRRGFIVMAFSKDDKNKRFHYQDNFGPQIVVTRFLHIWSMLKKFNSSDYRYVITTDVRDVIFQTNPSNWLELNIGNKLINVASESMYYVHEDWSNMNMHSSFGSEIYDHMKYQKIYNAGTLAGCFTAIRDIVLNVFLLSRFNRVHNPDQAALNILLSLEPYKSITRFSESEDAWACQAGTTVDPSKINKYKQYLTEPEPHFDGNYVYTSKGIKFCIVHQYDRVPSWKHMISEKYN
jgi:hypothetical protein